MLWQKGSRLALLLSLVSWLAVSAPPREAQASGGAPGAKVEFSGPVAWQPWDKAVKQAAATGKPICLVVYAHWCPRCRELSPAFKDAEVVKLAKGLVMVHQNADDRPDWLQQKFGNFGGYVPRIFFLKADGSVATEITSGHARFPYFYQPNKVDQLKAAMKRALALKVPGKGKGKG